LELKLKKIEKYYLSEITRKFSLKDEKKEIQRIYFVDISVNEVQFVNMLILMLSIFFFWNGRFQFLTVKLVNEFFSSKEA
jgi:hypothetical protein